MYMRRALIDAIGRFDPAFGLGYGEDNDFCLRAAAAGFRNVLCEDAFVLHLGGSSFGQKRADLAERNMGLLLARHPRYLDLVHGYIAADPVRPLRALALSQHRVVTGRAPGILHVIHGYGGGTEYHVRMLIAACASAFRQYLLIADGDNWRLEEFAEEEVVSFAFVHAPDEPWSDFLGGIAARFGIGVIHLHNISGCREAMLTALPAIGIPYGYTVHDLNFACPTINFLDATGRYCHGVTDEAKCNACLAAQREFASIDVGVWRRRHRALVEGAAFVIAPSRWSAEMFERYFPGCAPAIVSHASGEGAPRDDAVLTRVALPDDGIPTVAVLGAIGPDKGSRRLERLVELTRARGVPLRWVLIGYLDRGREQMQSEDAVFTQHGPFDSREIGALLGHYRVRLVAFPSVGPETFSFTLSEAWAHGLPAIVPPIGALAERVGETGGGWILSAAEWEDDERLLDRIAAVLDAGSDAAWRDVAARARAAPQPTLAAMAEATSALWRAALERPALHARPISAARCLVALGYRAWQPPATAIAPVAAPAGTNGALGRLAHTALAIRHTLPGRVLYLLTPKPLVDALRKRL
jgi:glycosyltransferase involved in cell wall biosynthesis